MYHCRLGGVNNPEYQCWLILFTVVVFHCVKLLIVYYATQYDTMSNNSRLTIVDSLTHTQSHLLQECLYACLYICYDVAA